ncbi:MAG TPA: SGNH/GDSL hydrolase family protein [Solirubrobacteraceae bacterium]|nr:SGNH/GDSL hydrolase family protein [Solirubrobacteraceae bacterium]
MQRHVWSLVAGLVGLLVLAPAASAAHHKLAPAPKPVKGIMLSLGDSYSVGWQELPAGGQGSTHNGPADQLIPLAAARGWHLKLVNLGCGGATTTSMLTASAIGCAPQALAPGAPNYPKRSQTQAAVDFIKSHPRRVKVVTISIGGNDVDRCPTQPDPTGCVKANMPAAVKNLTKIVKRLRAAGGKQMRIIGSTYPDVELGLWVHPTVLGPDTLALVPGSISAFRDDINPGLKRAYASVGAAFVDVTKATGAYGPFVATTSPLFGQIPAPVARVCTLTYFCDGTYNIHMRTPGYHIIAALEAATLPKLK